MTHEMDALNLSSPERTLAELVGAARREDLDVFRHCIDPDPVDFGFRYDPMRSMYQIKERASQGDFQLGTVIESNENFRKYPFFIGDITGPDWDISFVKSGSSWLVTDLDMAGYE